MRMKNRWIGGFVLAAILSLAACAPPSQGGDASSEPSQAAPGASGSPAQSEDDGGGRYDY
jgi:hypothetical protein